MSQGDAYLYRLLKTKDLDNNFIIKHEAILKVYGHS
ncbi:hypothetical protein BXY82_1500 [Gelidibacter sediminis]|uniref:Uncharacterized protein n=1 Tax=Gelidibacter sediminis TaxID=1608710 RepID=A0A4V3F889_9FLAO|nr:hypothetical protein BXY82_1500 [Gelidibacter sediminis]